MTDITSALHFVFHIDLQVLTCLNQHPEMLDYIHVSDQFSGPKPAAE